MTRDHAKLAALIALHADMHWNWCNRHNTYWYICKCDSVDAHQISTERIPMRVMYWDVTEERWPVPGVTAL